MTHHATKTPFRFRKIHDDLLITNEVGDYGFFGHSLLERVFEDRPRLSERQKLNSLSILIEPDASWRLASLKRRLRHNLTQHGSKLSYLLLVPTLRCNLSCTYCQVSRAPVDAEGFDWTDHEIGLLPNLLERTDEGSLKIEFQGGEPTLRPDLLLKIIDLVKSTRPNAEFVICSNLVSLNTEIEAIIARDDVTVSTSIDGPASVMTANRTASDELTQTFFTNFHRIIDTYGPEKIAALPTITDNGMADPKALIDTYVDLGFDSIFLRPVNYVGFARKAHTGEALDLDRWLKFYRECLEYIVEINQTSYLEEYYLSLMVRQIFADLPHGYVDFRSPSRFATDYCVVDFDGRLYPTDEARMLTRTRHMDLSIGSLEAGFDRQKIDALNYEAIHQVDPDCQQCAYMPYCGIDPIDDLSRYGRIDMPKHDTWFCRRQMALFDLIFEKVLHQDVRWLTMFLKWIFRTESPPPAYALFHD